LGGRQKGLKTKVINGRSGKKLGQFQTPEGA